MSAHMTPGSRLQQKYGSTFNTGRTVLLFYLSPSLLPGCFSSVAVLYCCVSCSDSGTLSVYMCYLHSRSVLNTFLLPVYGLSVSDAAAVVYILSATLPPP